MKVHGTAKLPLPGEALLALKDAGWTYLNASEGTSYHAYRNRDFPRVLVQLSATNMAGDTDHVFLGMHGGGLIPSSPVRITTDELRRRLAAIERTARGLNDRVED